jgi:hypothetical protein
MASDETSPDSQLDASSFRPLRIWIPLLLLPLMVVARYVSVWFPELPMVWMVGAFVPSLLGLLILAWWVLLSRAWWVERVVGLVGVTAALALVIAGLDPTMLGPPIIVLTMPTALAAFAIALVLLSQMRSFQRTVWAVVVSGLVAGFSLLLTNEGASGDFSFGFSWRWQPSPEQVFLAKRESSKSEGPVKEPTAEAFQNPPWPGFRGPLREGVQRGVRFSSDWNRNPPEQLWRIPVGPAWSSFAVAHGFVLTQEQRGESEVIACYDADNGREVWAQGIRSRFFDALGGLGPRSTPTVADGSIYALTAEGQLVALNALDGAIRWQVDVRQLTGKNPPMWGYSCSPLVHNDLVVIHAVGDRDDGIMAFDTETGAARWSVPADKDSYSSLHLTRYFDQEQLVFLGETGALFLEPATGRRLLHHEFKIAGYRALQPAVIDDRRMVFTSEYAGSRMIELQATEDGLAADEIWTTRQIKPDFNDLVVHDGFLYGFDGAVFTCIDVKDGSRRWKKGRYGKGQVVLLADPGLLVVISEQGELVVLQANPDEHIELYSKDVLEGKTWNHPVVVGDRLYLRNAREAVCFRLPLAAEAGAEGQAKVLAIAR